MPTLIVNVPATAIPVTPRRPAQPKASLASDTGVKLVLPYAPKETELGGWGDQWDALERPGRLPIVRRTGSQLPTMGLTVLLARRDFQTPIEDLLATLRNLSYSRSRIVVAGLSRWERGPWHLEDVAVQGTQRQQGTNAITRATVGLSFVYAYNPAPRIGPVSGGHSKPKPPKKPAGPKAGSYTTRHYTIKKGDTARKLATRFYGIPGEWKRIVRANKIEHPNAPKVGRRIVIPALPRPSKKR